MVESSTLSRAYCSKGKTIILNVDEERIFKLGYFKRIYKISKRVCNLTDLSVCYLNHNFVVPIT